MSAGSTIGQILDPWNGIDVSFTEERCVDPVQDQEPTIELKVINKTHPKDRIADESEKTSFIPEAVDPSSANQTCDPCSSPMSCKTLFCSVITCGLYRVCQCSILSTCQVPPKSSPNKPENVGHRTIEQDGEEYPDTNWSDIHINGVKVVPPKDDSDVYSETLLYVSPSGVHAETRVPSLHESMRFDDFEDSEEDVDSLITKKLLELYSEYQIEELARCTSDSVFVRKSKAISQLINSLAEEHKMDEQEAECRLVRGIIRISTRKSKKKRPVIPKMEWTLSDSGNETMTGTEFFISSNNNNYNSHPNIQISQPTSSDNFARKMYGKKEDSPSGLDLDSSGVPLIQTLTP